MTTTADTAESIRFLVRCCLRRGRSWDMTIAQVRASFGWSLARDVIARREFLA